jgi:pantoate--beta-alanine ligase
MSSRNQYLTAEQRAAAVALPDAMREAIGAIEGGAPVRASLDTLLARLHAAGFGPVDYAELADAASLAVLDQRPQTPARLLVAARIGLTRLIDNMAVAPVG